VRPSPLALRSSDGTGLAAELWPAAAGAPGVAIVHGAGSRKENHGDFARLCREAGMSALTLDLRGHGASGGEPGPGMLDDVMAALDALAERGAGRLGVRGSSLGGFLALHAASRHPAARAAVALCPAGAERLARLYEADWPLALPLEPAVARPGVARAFWHATGDDRVPWAGTRVLAGLSPPPIQLRVVLGGGHQTLQHDPVVLTESVAFLREHLAA
jgi:alpha-beta hydrolase superfamily lysophospholipase